MLKEYKKLKQHIRMKSESLLKLYDDCFVISDMKPHEIQKTHSGNAPYENKVYKYVQENKKLEKEKQKLIKLYEQIQNILLQLPNDYEFIIQKIDLNEEPEDIVMNQLNMPYKAFKNLIYNAHKMFYKFTKYY